MSNEPPTPSPDLAESDLQAQSVMVSLRLSDGDFGSDEQRAQVYELEDRLAVLIGEAEVGMLGGDGFGEGAAELFFYGPKADALFKVIAAEVRQAATLPGSFAILRYGSIEDLDAAELTIPLS